jgi:hypothetical protein
MLQRGSINNYYFLSVLDITKRPSKNNIDKTKIPGIIKKKMIKEYNQKDYRNKMFREHSQSSKRIRCT